MGAREAAPPMPEIEATLLPDSELSSITFTQRECNWFQALEGDIDTSHFVAAWRHRAARAGRSGQLAKYQVAIARRTIMSTDTDWGTMYCAYRPAEDGQDLLAVRAFVFPFWTFIPRATSRTGDRARLGADGRHPHDVRPSPGSRRRARRRWRAARRSQARRRRRLQPNTTDWYGRWRPVQNAANDYLIDREAQRNDVIYTGITHIAMQDQAITESMGDIVDHSFEHLAPSDQMITRTRRRLLMAARALRDKRCAALCG